jgi:hypothetical protein
MSHSSLRTTAPPCLSLGIKDSLKEDIGLLLFGLFGGEGFCFYLGFCFWLLDFLAF